jgi:hypothetical protein
MLGTGYDARSNNFFAVAYASRIEKQIDRQSIKVQIFFCFRRIIKKKTMLDFIQKNNENFPPILLVTFSIYLTYEEVLTGNQFYIYILKDKVRRQIQSTFLCSVFFFLIAK